MSGDQPVFQSLSVNGIAVDPGPLDNFAQRAILQKGSHSVGFNIKIKGAESIIG